MGKKVITTRHPPKAPYSAGIETEQFIFTAGTVGYEDPDTGAEIKGIEAQTRRCLENIKEILDNAGSSLSDVISATVYLSNRDDFPKMNEVYKTYFPEEPPARATIITGLVSTKMLVEIQCIAIHHK